MKIILYNQKNNGYRQGFKNYKNSDIEIFQVEWSNKFLGEEINMEQKRDYANFDCKRCGCDSYAACSDGDELAIGQSLKINESSDLSDIIKFNNGGCVYSISLIKNPSFSLWGYEYEIEVMAQGPSGLGTGSGYLRFTDKTGDAYSLSITDSSKKKHVVDYKSSDPEITRVEWSNHSF